MIAICAGWLGREEGRGEFHSWNDQHYHTLTLVEHLPMICGLDEPRKVYK